MATTTNRAMPTVAPSIPGTVWMSAMKVGMASEIAPPPYAIVDRTEWAPIAQTDTKPIQR
jgi:hypothetical protein